jgi:hypothetical protein
MSGLGEGVVLVLALVLAYKAGLLSQYESKRTQPAQASLTLQPTCSSDRFCTFSASLRWGLGGARFISSSRRSDRGDTAQTPTR